jgi:hypothetical protein
MTYNPRVLAKAPHDNRVKRTAPAKWIGATCAGVGLT